MNDSDMVERLWKISQFGIFSWRISMFRRILKFQIVIAIFTLHKGQDLESYSAGKDALLWMAIVERVLQS